MDPRQPMIERNAHFTRGPRFFREGATVMFEFVIDATNSIGPRPAHGGDKVSHPTAWSEFVDSDEFSPPKPADEPVYGPQVVAEHDQGQPREKRAYTRRKPLAEGV